jgi:MFS family permease
MSARATHLRNLLAVTLPELLWGFASALTIEAPIPAAFRGYLCGGEWFLGAWTLVSALASACAMLFTAWYVLPFVRKRAFVVVGHLVTGALYLPVILLARALGDEDGASDVGALLGIGFFALSLGLLMPAWMALIGTLFPEGQRSRVLGLLFVLNRIGGVLGGLAAEAVLRSAWDVHDQWLWLWGVAAIVAFLGGVPFLWIREVDGDARPRPPLGAYLRQLLSAARGHPALRRFMLVDLLGVSGWILLAYYGDVAFRDRGVHPEHAGRLTAVAAFAQLLGALLVAVVGGRLRPRRGLAVGALCAAAAAVLTCLATTASGFLVVAALSGFYMVSRQTCHGPQLMRLAGARDPTAALSLGMAVASVVQALLPFLAGLLRPVTGFPPLLLLVTGSTLLCAWLLWTRVSDGPSVGVRTS